MKHVGMIGEGAWGTAVATLLAHNGYTVHLWCHDASVQECIATTGYNARYLPDIKLSPLIIPTTDLSAVIAQSPWIFEALPVKFLRSVLMQARGYFSSEQKWVILSKGIEQQTLLLPSQIIDDVFQTTVCKAAILGPSFALDLAQEDITAVTVGADTCDLSLALQQMLSNDYFRPYLSLDLIGVQVGSAIKNVITLGIGILDGAGFRDNAKAFLLTRGLHEIVLVATALGGKPETVYGLSGVGDLVLTAMGSLSRNLAVGKSLGQGKSLEAILEQTGYIPEGINTVQSLYQLAMQKGLDLPVCTGIYQVIFEHKTIQSVLEELMARPLERECLTS